MDAGLRAGTFSTEISGMTIQQISELFRGVNQWSKSAGNPIITPEGSEVETTFGYVWLEGATYHLYYTYFDESSKSIIGHATSTDGVSFTRDSANNPVLNRGAGGAWDEGGCWCPQVWREGATWYMTYTGRNASAYDVCVGLATSPDGIVWTKYAGNPVLSGGLAGSGDWDERTAESSAIIKVSNTYYLWYCTLPDASVPRQVGLATSTDLHTWTKHASNPIFGTDDGYGMRMQAFPFKWGGYYYLVVTHYTSERNYSELELWRSYYPTFLQGGYPNRELVSIIHRPSGSGWDGHECDVPCMLTTDITRSSFPGNLFRLYYSAESGNVWAMGLLTASDLNAATRQLRIQDYDPWSAPSRTLTQPAAEVTQAVAGPDITVTQSCDFDATFTDLGDLTDRVELYWCMKSTPKDAPDEALVLASETSGIIVLNGEEPANPALGTITVDNEDSGTVTVHISGLATQSIDTVLNGVHGFRVKTATGAREVGCAQAQCILPTVGVVQ